MERLRRKRSPSRVSSPSKVTTIVDWSSDEKLKPSNRPHGGNEQQTIKHRIKGLESDSSSCAGEDAQLDLKQLAFKSGHIKPKLPSVTLMKSLLADEMAREKDYRRRPPSVIAKLMGLDGFPSQLISSKQPRRYSDGFQGKYTSGKSARSRRSCNGHSSRKLVKDQQHIKDVYEVEENSPFHLPGNRNKFEDQIGFSRKLCKKAKHPSTDEELLDSKGVLHSNNHLYLKFLHEPDLLFARGVHDRHVSHRSQCEHIQSLRPSDVLNYNTNAIGCQSGREASQKIDISLSHEYQEGHRHHSCRRRVQQSDKSIDFSAHSKDDIKGTATQIVVLKPNFAKMREAAKSSSSSRDMLSDIKLRKNHADADAGSSEDSIWGKKSILTDLEISALNSQESKELAKEITSQVRHRLGEDSLNASRCGRRGYSADESSHNMSGNDSSCDSDQNILPSQTPTCRRNRSKSLQSRCSESSVNREARKRLLERWKIAHRFEEKKVASKGSTLGEMLTLYDLDAKRVGMHRAVAQDECSIQYGQCSSREEQTEPLGISSKDGWKEGYIVTLRRSRSLPRFRDHEGSFSHCSFKEASRHGRNKAVKKDLARKEGSSPFGSLRVAEKEGSSFCASQICKVTVDKMDGEQIRRNWKKNHGLEEKGSSELKRIVVESSTGHSGTELNPDAMVEVVNESAPETLHSGDRLMETAVFSTHKHGEGGSSGSDSQETTSQELSRIRERKEDSACLAYPAAEGEQCALSRKESDQPSPVSVFEGPLVDYLSSGSDCFERVSAELQGLRMQLKLLKLESQGSSDEEGGIGIGSIPGRVSVSSDDETLEGPSCEPKSESWETCYVADALAELGIMFEDGSGSSPEAFIGTWESSDCPLGSRVFEKLEKKYGVESESWGRPERRFLFDRINTGIVQVTEKYSDPYPWVKQNRWPCYYYYYGRGRGRGNGNVVVGGGGVSWREDGLRVEVWKALESEEESLSSSSSWDSIKVEAAEWTDMGKQMDDIGREIGRMILDELTGEALTILTE